LIDGELADPAEAARWSAALPGAASGDARITRFQPEEVTVQTRSEGPALLVLAEAFFPGWHASVDGAAAPIGRADFLARAVLVPAGTHEVRFWYEVPSVRAGLHVTLATLACGIVVAVTRMRKRRR
jgi:hypothetical protein